MRTEGRFHIRVSRQLARRSRHRRNCIHISPHIKNRGSIPRMLPRVTRNPFRSACGLRNFGKHSIAKLAHAAHAHAHHRHHRTTVCHEISLLSLLRFSGMITHCAALVKHFLQKTAGKAWTCTGKRDILETSPISPPFLRELWSFYRRM